MMEYYLVIKRNEIHGQNLKKLYEVKEVRHKDHTLYNFIYRKCPEKAHQQRKKQISGRLVGCGGSREIQSDS